MMPRHVWKLAAVSCLVLVLSGCWSRHELNELAIVVGIGIDKEGEDYKVSVQVVNPGQVSTRYGMSNILKPVVTYANTGQTVPEAIRKISLLSSKRLYFSHLRMVVFGETLARQGIHRSIDYISRNPEMRNDFFLVVAKKSTPEEILSTFSSMDPIPANNIYMKLSNSDNLWAATGQISLDRLLMDLMTTGKNPTMTAIKIAGNKGMGFRQMNNNSIKPAAVLEYEGMAAFKGERMVGWLDEDQTKALNYLQDSVRQTLGVVQCPDGGYASLDITHSKTTIKVGREGQLPVIDATVRLQQDVSDVECQLDMNKVETIDIFRKAGEEKVVELLEKGVEYAQKKLRSDIFGFGQEVHRQQPAMWHRIKDWNTVFPDVKVHIHSIVEMRKIGSTAQPIQEEKRK